MKYAADFKRIARDALFGNWRTAVLTGFVASLLGGTIASSGVSGSSNSSNSSDTDLSSVLQNTEAYELILSIFISLAAIVAVLSLVKIVLGGATKLGYAKFNLNLIYKKPVAFSNLFSQYDRIGQGFVMNFLTGLYLVLWTLLLIVPGIIKTYSYAMTPYILAEHPEMTVNQAITESRRIMNGNKGRLFCLNFSFIGWAFLMLVPIFVLMPLFFLGTVGVVIWAVAVFASIIVGSLFLTPYQEAAYAAFYREITHYDPAYQNIEL